MNGALQSAVLLVFSFRNGEIIDTLFEAKVLIERWCVHYNTVRPDSALNEQPAAPETLLHTKYFTIPKLYVILT